MQLSPNARGFKETGPEIDYGRMYDYLLTEAKAIGQALGVPDDIYDTTLRLVDDLKDYDVRIACESLQGLPLALMVANTIEEFYGSPVDKVSVWSAFMLHDIGKGVLPHELNDKSHEGTDWTDEDIELMRVHVAIGYYLALDSGLPKSICRPIAESHGKQLRRVYGMNPVLSPGELHVRNCVAIADADDAMLTRLTTYNKHMSSAERVGYIQEYVRNACTDYENNGPELAERIIARLVPQAGLLAS